METARRLQARHGLGFPLLHASAERVPLPDASFDLAFSEYGAAIWCDPYAWIPEAHRLLRLGGRLIFLGNSVQAMLCAPPSEDPVGETLQRPQFGGLYRMEWPDEEGVNFCLPHGENARVPTLTTRPDDAPADQTDRPYGLVDLRPRRWC